MIRKQHDKTYSENIITLPIGGIYKYRHGGETHAYQAKTIHLLQTAVGKDSYELFKKYSTLISELPPIHLRDLLDFRKNNKAIHLRKWSL